MGTRSLSDSSGARPLFFKLGDDLVRALGNNFAAFDSRLQNEVMIPRLVAGEFSAAFEDGLEFLNSQLTVADAVANLPVPEESGNASPPRPVSPAEQPQNGFGQMSFVLLLLFALAMVIMRMRKRIFVQEDRPPNEPTKLTKTAPPEEQQRVGVDKATLSELSALLIDLNSADPKPGDAYLPEDMTQQSDMALLTGLLTEERPVDLKNLQDEYLSNVSRLQIATQRFNALRNNADASQEDYKVLLTEVRDIKGFSTRLGKTFEEVQQEISELDPRIDALDAKLATVGAAYEAARGSGWPDSLQVFSPLEEKP